MRKLIMWNVISLNGYFEGEKAWDLDFHDLAWGKELESFSIEQLKSAVSKTKTPRSAVSANWRSHFEVCYGFKIELNKDYEK